MNETRGTDYEALAQALETMNNVSLHQADRLFPPYDVGGTLIPMRMHPLTCGNNSDHTPLFPFWNGERVQLICRDCDYTQNNSGPCRPTDDGTKTQSQPETKSAENITPHANNNKGLGSKTPLESTTHHSTQPDEGPSVLGMRKGEGA